MLFLAILLLIFALLFDLMFYVPLTIHIYFDNNRIYIGLFSIDIIKIDSESNINRLKNKISLQKIFESEKEDLKIIESLSINKIILRLKKEQISRYAYVFYPLLTINKINQKIDYQIASENKLYMKVNVKIVNVLMKKIQIRRLKNERASNK